MSRVFKINYRKKYKHMPLITSLGSKSSNIIDFFFYSPWRYCFISTSLSTLSGWRVLSLEKTKPCTSSRSSPASPPSPPPPPSSATSFVSSWAWTSKNEVTDSQWKVPYRKCLQEFQNQLTQKSINQKVPTMCILGLRIQKIFYPGFDEFIEVNEPA